MTEIGARTVDAGLGAALAAVLPLTVSTLVPTLPWPFLGAALVAGSVGAVLWAGHWVVDFVHAGVGSVRLWKSTPLREAGVCGGADDLTWGMLEMHCVLRYRCGRGESPTH